MSEYIKREAALRIVENYGKSAIESGRKTLDPVDDIISLATGVDLIPAEDVVEVRHGEWYLLDECANEGVYCSVCHKKVYKTDYANQKLKSKFCPNCGAKMDKRSDTE